MTSVTLPTLAARLAVRARYRSSLQCELGNQRLHVFHECRALDNAIEARLPSRVQTRRIRVIRVAENRHRRVGIGDLAGLDAGDIDDDEVGLLDALGRDQ